MIHLSNKSIKDKSINGGEWQDLAYSKNAKCGQKNVEELERANNHFATIVLKAGSDEYRQ